MDQDIDVNKWLKNGKLKVQSYEDEHLFKVEIDEIPDLTLVGKCLEALLESVPRIVTKHRLGISTCG